MKVNSFHNYLTHHLPAITEFLFFWGDTLVVTFLNVFFVIVLFFNIFFTYFLEYLGKLWIFNELFY